MRLFPEKLRFVLGFALLPLAVSSIWAAELSVSEKQKVASVARSINQSIAEKRAGDFAAAGESIKRAMQQIEQAVETGSPALYDALVPAMDRVISDRVLMELDGIILPPFDRPRRPTTDDLPKSMDGNDNADPSASQPADGTAAGPVVGFSKEVAPILIQKCGSCHVSGSKGGFNMSSYAALMKGSRAGAVVFARDVANSVLVELIELGTMPPGGAKVSPQQLQVLKDWIASGAEFDGQDPNAPLGSLSSAAPPTPTPRETPEIRRATGDETVRFASEIAPLLIDACKGCHLDAMRTSGGLRLDTFAQMMRGGDSGPIIVPGKADESLLIQKLRGESGDRMPSGGRPAFSNESIQLIATWINEGALLDGLSKDQPLRVMSLLAWVANASPQEVSAKRMEMSQQDMRLITTRSDELQSTSTDHFYVTGSASLRTMELVAEQAEEQLKKAKSFVPGQPGESYFGGKATLFVMPRRYDYSELTKMIESREVPTDWNSHWKYDGLKAYVALVASDDDSEEVIKQRLAAPLVSLAVATRSSDVPRWFAQGVGASIAAKATRTDRETQRNYAAEIASAVAAMSDAKQFFEQKLKPEETDRISTAIADSMLDRGRRSSFDSLMRKLDETKQFEQAFQQAFRLSPEAYVSAWLKWVRGR